VSILEACVDRVTGVKAADCQKGCRGAGHRRGASSLRRPSQMAGSECVWYTAMTEVFKDFDQRELST